MVKVVAMELNELSFDLIRKYVDQGKLPTFAKLLRDRVLTRTRAEKDYHDLEPWIQWPTVYTGQTLAEHGIFRMGDACQRRAKQIWERLEEASVSVGAISPINARNDCVHPSFFVPDPWSGARAAGPQDLQTLAGVVGRMVNANAHGKFAKSDLWLLLRLGLPYVRLSSIPDYLRIVLASVKNRWARALVLDRLLADIFLKLWKRTGVEYSSLFLNAVAHIQHHHMYDSAAYEGDAANPDWYAKASRIDPLVFAYGVYDRILADYLALDARLLITTALSQTPNDQPYCQYRFKDHASLLPRLGLQPARVATRMSRDFTLFFETPAQAAMAARVLRGLKVGDEPLMFVEDRGAELFCQIAFRGAHEQLSAVSSGGSTMDLREAVLLISIENGIHQTIGYHMDCGLSKEDPQPAEMPLAQLYGKILGLFGVDEKASVAA